MKKVKLGEVCEIRIGKTPNRSQTLYWGGDYPWLSISDMKGKILCTTKEKITQEAVQKEKMQIVSKGTVVMSFKLSIGKVGILAENMYTNEAIANFVVKNNKMLFNEYLYYALQGMNFDSLTDRAVMGRTLNKAKLNNLSIVYNEPFMQQQIVLRLDGVNKLIESRKQQLSELSKLVKSRFNEMFILNDFSLKRLGELVEEVRYGTSLPATLNGKYGYLRMNNITEDGKLNIQNLKYIDIPEKDLEKYVVRKGDVLFNRTNSIELVGKTCIYELNFDMVIAGYIIRIRTNNNILNSRYLSEFLNFPSTKKFLRNIAKGAVNQANINAKELQDISVPLPPLSLQNEFADFVAQVDKSQLAIQKSLEELETLKKSLMQEYFG